MQTAYRSRSSVSTRRSNASQSSTLRQCAARVARAFIAESEGVYRPSWTIDEVAENLDAIRDQSRQWIFPQQTGFAGHMARSFEMVSRG